MTTTNRMNDKQLESLNQLHAALAEATSSGLLDELACCFSHPDTVNDFCDSIADMHKYVGQTKVKPAGSQ